MKNSLALRLSLLLLGALCVFLVLGIPLGVYHVENGEELALKDVGYIRDIYEIDGDWRLVFDAAAGTLDETCAETEVGCLTDSSASLSGSGIVEFELPLRLEINYVSDGEAKTRFASAANSLEVLRSLGLENAPFVVVRVDEQVKRLEEVHDPLIP